MQRREEVETQIEEGTAVPLGRAFGEENKKDENVIVHEKDAVTAWLVLVAYVGTITRILSSSNESAEEAESVRKFDIEA